MYEIICRRIWVYAAYYRRKYTGEFKASSEAWSTKLQVKASMMARLTPGRKK